MKSITAKELKDKLLQGEHLILIDVREPFEHHHFNIGGINIPLNTIIEHKESFNHNQAVIIYCQKGIRSQIAIQRLEDKFGFQSLINLQGGVSEWQKHFNQKKHDE